MNLINRILWRFIPQSQNIEGILFAVRSQSDSEAVLRVPASYALIIEDPPGVLRQTHTV